MNWPAHHLGGPDFDAYEPIEHPWTREDEPEPEQEPVNAGAIMNVENDPDWEIQAEVIPDWANPQQLNRFLPVEQAIAETEAPVIQCASKVSDTPQ